MTKSFKNLIREKRTEEFPSAFDIVHKTFLKLGLNNEPPDYFFKNASTIVEKIRENNWSVFLEQEKQFSEKLYKTLIRDDINTLNPRDAVEDFIHQNTDKFYILSLSNTQSRRSRAGGEFEAIISHLFMGADLPFDEQGLVGTGIFADKNLAKLVDHVIPGATEYGLNKKNIMAISAKTTLRERWQQIGDEMQRTKMPEIYLATLDKTIGANTLNQLYNNNIYPVTTMSIKNECYPNSNIVITFEELLLEAKNITEKWHIDNYSSDDISEKIKKIEKSLNEHNEKEYINNYLTRRLTHIKKLDK